jgi:hypothetical protein
MLTKGYHANDDDDDDDDVYLIRHRALKAYEVLEA